MQQQKQKKDTTKKRQVNSYLKYSGMAIQMGIIILAGVYAGKKMDEKLGSAKPIWTVIFALLSIFVALYTSLKDIWRKPD